MHWVPNNAECHGRCRLPKTGHCSKRRPVSGSRVVAWVPCPRVATSKWCIDSATAHLQIVATHPPALFHHGCGSQDGSWTAPSPTLSLCFLPVNYS